MYTAEDPMKIAAAGVPVVVSPLILYSDDFSGNRSKKWNKFDAWCVTLASLPMKEARKFENIHFIACSNVVSAVDTTEPLVEDLLTLENGLKMFDACTQREVLVVAPVICCLCDNVRASELLNHLGSKAVKFCRFCMVGLSMNMIIIMLLYKF